MSKNQVNITYYQFNIKLKLFNNSITKEKYVFGLYFYAFGQKPLTNIFISFLIKSNYSSKENILIKFKPKNNNEKDLNDYSSVDGTSYSCTIFTGILALILEKNPNISYKQI